MAGAIDGRRVRGPLTLVEGRYYLLMGPAWCRDNAPAAGSTATVTLQPEGPPIADDFAAALAAEPEAQRFFYSVATFYRKNYVRWIETAKRAETRAGRIQETIALLKAHRRER